MVRAHARAFFKYHWMDEFLSGWKDGYCPWESEGIPKTARDSFCDDKNQYILQLKRLLSSFIKIDHVANIADLIYRVIVLRGQIFDNRVLQNSDL